MEKLWPVFSVFPTVSTNDTSQNAERFANAKQRHGFPQEIRGDSKAYGDILPKKKP